MTSLSPGSLSCLVRNRNISDTLCNLPPHVVDVLYTKGNNKRREHTQLWSRKLREPLGMGKYFKLGCMSSNRSRILLHQQLSNLGLSETLKTLNMSVNKLYIIQNVLKVLYIERDVQNILFVQGVRSVRKFLNTMDEAYQSLLFYISLNLASVHL